MDPLMAKLEVTAKRTRPKPAFSLDLKGKDICMERSNYPTLPIAKADMVGWRSQIQRVQAKKTGASAKAHEKRDWVRAHPSLAHAVWLLANTLHGCSHGCIIADVIMSDHVLVRGDHS